MAVRAVWRSLEEQALRGMEAVEAVRAICSGVDISADLWGAIGGEVQWLAMRWGLVLEEKTRSSRSDQTHSDQSRCIRMRTCNVGCMVGHDSGSRDIQTAIITTKLPPGVL